MGVRFGTLGAIVLRSVCGVKANGGRPASELLAGIVAGLTVVRSVLSTQVASAIWPCSKASRRSHRPAAWAAEGSQIVRTSAARPPHPARLRECIRPSRIVFLHGNAIDEDATRRCSQSVRAGQRPLPDKPVRPDGAGLECAPEAAPNIRKGG